MLYTKEQWLEDFRNYAETISTPSFFSFNNRRYGTETINKRIRAYCNKKLSSVKKQAFFEGWDSKRLLNEMLLITYVPYIVMLEYRNKIWPYDYITFSRRIGELWEPFCRLAFEYPLKELRIITPPDFKRVQHNIQKSALKCIDSLEVSQDMKRELRRHYEIPWALIDSGGTKLALDLHFEQAGIHYNCDFKSGFGSNEKGNTNRLLLVASIYHSLGKLEKNLLFVRQKESENNHYFQTLKNSPYWEVFCADDCYAAIESFTGFSLRTWLDNNADWKQDMNNELKEHLQENDLLKYLTW